MDALSALAIAGAGLAAGAINVVVGSGSLITFPTLLAVGYSPLVANVSNTVGLVPGSLSGIHAYRRELSGQGRRAAFLGLFSSTGAVIGSLLLLRLPETSFRRIVPYLILLACALVALQPWLTKWLRPYGAAHAALRPPGPDPVRRRLCHGHLRRLLRGRAGRDPDRHTGHLY